MSVHIVQVAFLMLQVSSHNGPESKLSTCEHINCIISHGVCEPNIIELVR